MTALDTVMGAAWSAVRGELDAPTVEFVGAPALASAFPVSALLSGSVGVVGAALAGLRDAVGLPDGPITVDRPLVDRWARAGVVAIGWTVPSPWDAVAGDYRGSDGWIRLHTNAAHHRRAAMSVLGTPEDRQAVADAVAGWPVDALETAVVAAGGAAAAMRSLDEWERHPQGEAVAGEPLVAWVPSPAGSISWSPTDAAPLTGVRVLDLTRVIAGPVATRELAGLGATVLRIDPPWWTEVGVEQELTLGKQVAGLDLGEAGDLERLHELVRGADVLVHGYRADALDRLGLGAAELQRLRPGLVDVALDAYGWTGPWRDRRGFDSLVQMSTGIADAGMRWAGAEKPTPLPVQALDVATGWFAAAAALEGLRRAIGGASASARLSLAATASLLVGAGDPEPPDGDARDHRPVQRFDTPWGPVGVLAHPLVVAGRGAVWQRGPRPLRSDAPEWPGAEWPGV